MAAKLKEFLTKKSKKTEEQLPTRPVTLLTNITDKLDKFIAGIDKEAQDIKDPEKRKTFENHNKTIRNAANDLRRDLNKNYDLWMDQVLKLKLTYEDYVPMVAHTLKNYEQKFKAFGGEAVMTDMKSTITSVTAMLEKKADEEHPHP